MNIRKHIPNTLTCANLAFGCYACILALCGNYLCAVIAIFIAAGFDFLDGFAARLLKAFSPIGKDLDSLADMVSFGVAPGMILFDFLDRLQKTVDGGCPVYGKLFLLAAFAIPVFSALRLAKFNNDERQKTSFVGLPVPANAIFWAPLIYVLSPLVADKTVFPGLLPVDFSADLSGFPVLGLLIVLSLLALGMSLLLVSEIPMFSLKIKSLAWKGNELRYILILSAVVLVVCFGFLGITITMLLYILLSIFNNRV
ncbi:MAG: CDP-alcohol phosphatidyltransferase family protein [Tannerella sp.]|jgi:CDP-diacylglycerol--serine O-phosphatidyltransferase|nr:CDP-alcohol phosphatidyltransferase family protein [Tannerella sp.]